MLTDPAAALSGALSNRPGAAVDGVLKKPQDWMPRLGGDDMQGRHLISGVAYSPETLKVIRRAFDDAWDTIKHHFEGNLLSVEVARLRLSNAILDVAKEDSRDSDELKRLGLRAMALRIDPAPEVVMGRRLHRTKYWRSYS